MQFNVMPRTGGLAINKGKFKEKEGCDGIILTLGRGLVAFVSAKSGRRTEHC